MNPDFEGHIYTTGADRSSALQLQADFDTLRPQQRDKIKRIATEANEAHHSISFDQLKSHRRFLIGRGLVDLVMSDNCDEDLIRSVCGFVTGFIMKTAGGAVGHLDAQEAQEFYNLCHRIRYDEQDIEYYPKTNLFGFPKQAKAGK